MCVCVCVCLCVHRQFSTQAGFPNRFLCVFCTSLRYFRRIPTHMQPKSVSFSSPLACSSYLALKRICCHCHYQHVFLVSPGFVYRHLVKYGFSSGASIRSQTLPWILYEQNPSTMKCSRGQLRNNGACCAHENAHVRFQLRTASSSQGQRCACWTISARPAVKTKLRAVITEIITWCILCGVCHARSSQTTYVVGCCLCC